MQNVYTESEYCTFRVPNLCLTHPGLTIYVYTVLRLVLSLAVSASRPCPLNGRRRRSRQHFVQRTPHYLMSLCYCDLVARPWNRSIPCGSTKPPGPPRIHSHIGTLGTINSLTLSRFDYAPRPKPLATHDEELHLYRFTRKGRRRCFCPSLWAEFDSRGALKHDWRAPSNRKSALTVIARKAITH